MYAEIENDIVAELKAKLPANVHVLTSAELADIAEASQPTPAVHVVYRGYNPLESRQDGRAARVELTWLTVISTRNHRSSRSGDAAREDASALANQVAGALMGFKAKNASDVLKLTSAPPVGYQSGHCYLPIGFTTQTLLRSDQ